MRLWPIACVALMLALPAAAQPPKPYVDPGTETRRAREREERREAHHHQQRQTEIRRTQESVRPQAPRPSIDERAEIRRAQERDAQRHREPPPVLHESVRRVAPRPYIDETAQARRSRSVTCRAAPVCGQAGQTCRPVEWTYAGADTASFRRDIARLCEVANTPDGCSCVSQCARTVSCSF
jgi:hypothetical protein